MKFDCECCGCCCRSIGKFVVGAIAAMDEAEKTGAEIHPILEEIASFPYDISPEGACSKLSGDLCSIYETRPLVCNTDAMFDKYWQHVMTREQWYAESKKSCAKLKLKGAHESIPDPETKR